MLPLHDGAPPWRLPGGPAHAISRALHSYRVAGHPFKSPGRIVKDRKRHAYGARRSFVVGSEGLEPSPAWLRARHAAANTLIPCRNRHLVLELRAGASNFRVAEMLTSRAGGI